MTVNSHPNARLICCFWFAVRALCFTLLQCTQSWTRIRHCPTAKRASRTSKIFPIYHLPGAEDISSMSTLTRLNIVPDSGVPFKSWRPSNSKSRTLQASRQSQLRCMTTSTLQKTAGSTCTAHTNLSIFHNARSGY